MDIFNNLFEDFKKGINNVIDKLNNQDLNMGTENIKITIDSLKTFKNLYLNNKLEFENLIEKVKEYYFPSYNNFHEVFKHLLEINQDDLNFLIKQFLKGYILSKEDILNNKRETILNKIVEAFKSSINKNKKLEMDYEYFIAFSTRYYVSTHLKKNFEKVISLLNLNIIEDKYYDTKTGEHKIRIKYVFPDEIVNLLVEFEYITEKIYPNQEKKYYIKSNFDVNLFWKLILCNFILDRTNLNTQRINGICGFLALIILLSVLNEQKPNIELQKFEDVHQNKDSISVIPPNIFHSQIFLDLQIPLIKIFAYKIGYINWLKKIYDGPKARKFHSQGKFIGHRYLFKVRAGQIIRINIEIINEIRNMVVYLRNKENI